MQSILNKMYQRSFLTPTRPHHGRGQPPPIHTPSALPGPLASHCNVNRAKLVEPHPGVSDGNVHVESAGDVKWLFSGGRAHGFRRQ